VVAAERTPAVVAERTPAAAERTPVVAVERTPAVAEHTPVAADTEVDSPGRTPGRT